MMDFCPRLTYRPKTVYTRRSLHEYSKIELSPKQKQKQTKTQIRTVANVSLIIVSSGRHRCGASWF